MTNSQLEAFRQLAAAMQTESTDWQWIGPHMSQRMFGITETRAKDYAQRHGGIAQPLEPMRESWACECQQQCGDSYTAQIGDSMVFCGVCVNSLKGGR